MVDPLIPAAADGGRRTALIGDPRVGTAEDEDLDQLVEDDPIGDARSVTDQGMPRPPIGKKRRELLPDGLDEE
jgi:hypothetical protein